MFVPLAGIMRDLAIRDGARVGAAQGQTGYQTMDDEKVITELVLARLR